MKYIIVVICLVLLTCCGESATKNNTPKNNIKKAERPKSLNSINLSLSNNEELVTIADKIKKYLSDTSLDNFPTENDINDINSLLNGNILLVDTTNYILYFNVNKAIKLNFKYVGKTNNIFVFNNSRSLLIINVISKEKYVFVFSPETLYGKSKLQAVFSLNNQLMPVFSVKKKLDSVRFGIEKYPYVDNYGMDFMALSYKYKTQDFDKLSLGDLPILFGDNLKKLKPDTVFFRNGRMFLNTPLWDDSGGFYLFQ